MASTPFNTLTALFAALGAAIAVLDHALDLLGEATAITVILFVGAFITFVIAW